MPALPVWPPLRSAGLLCAIFVAALLIGCALAPPLHRFLVGLGRAHGALEGLRDLEFISLLSRLVLVLTLLGFALGIRRFGISGPSGVGLVRPGWGRELGWAWLVGLALMAGMGVWGVLDGGYAFQPSAAALRRTLFFFLFAGLLIGILEEVLFRGVLFGGLRSRLSFWPAAFASSLVFALIHFAQPVPEAGVAHAHWGAGFQLLGDLFRNPAEPGRMVPSVYTLFLLGLVLCGLYELRRSLWASIGLHAGIIVGMKALSEAVVEGSAVSFWFGQSTFLSKTWAAAALALALMVAMAWSIGKKRGG